MAANGLDGAPAGSPGASIRIFLVNGTPEGLRLVEKSNWTGLGIICPRSEYPTARQRDEFSRPGVYVLIGPGDSALPQIYVGEAEELRSRLDSHQQTKDFWTRLIAFTSKDGNINKAHVRYLESRLVALANAAKRTQVENGTAPSLPALSEPDTADTENFLREMLVIFPVLEVSAFHVPGPTQTLAPGSQGAGSELRLTGPQTDAIGMDTPEGFVVRTGSRGRVHEVPSMHEWLRNLRHALIQKGILVVDAEQLVVTQDYTFESPSSAAGVLLGRAANGRTEWKGPDGKTLKEIQSAAVAQPGGPGLGY